MSCAMPAVLDSFAASGRAPAAFRSFPTAGLREGGDAGSAPQFLEDGRRAVPHPVGARAAKAYEFKTTPLRSPLYCCLGVLLSPNKSARAK
eukprot:2789014-Alexandrium_andersonii.AAC.1